MLLTLKKKECASKEYFEAYKEQRLAYHSKYHEANKDESPRKVKNSSKEQ